MLRDKRARRPKERELINLHVKFIYDGQNLLNKRSARRLMYAIPLSYDRWITLMHATAYRNSCWVCSCAHPIDAQLRPGR